MSPVSPTYPLACPICEESLDVMGTQSLACPNGHAFDVGKEDYVNLLPPQHRRKGIEGDSRDMLLARRRFLDAGHFEPLRTSIIERVMGLVGHRRRPAETPACVLETGAGEGCYIGGVAERMTAEAAPPNRPEPRFLGFDLSKEAARLAARQYPAARFFVADVHRRIYVASASTNVLLGVFAPRNAAEFGRVIEDGGHALLVIPGRTHLAEARETLGLIGIQPDKEASVVESMASDFRVSDRAELRFELSLSPKDLSDLVAMGPSSHHVSSALATSAAHETGESFSTEASFVILEFARVKAHDLNG